MRCRLFLAILVAAVLLSGFSGIRAENRRPKDAAEPPFGKLTVQEQKAVDDVLKSWEQHSKSIERYRCQFQRWEYDPVFGPAHTFKTWSKGAIMYSVPDGSLLEVEETWRYRAAIKSDDELKYVKREGESAEHWICGRTYIWEFDHESRRLIGHKLPSHMQGRMIVGFCPFALVLQNALNPHEETVDGPLQLLAEADAERMKQRYWIRRQPVAEGAREYRLELHPKSSRHAKICQKMDVIIAQEDFLPKVLVVYDRNFDPGRNPARTTFVFEKRQTNWTLSSNQLNIFHRQFVEPEMPPGWKKVVIDTAGIVRLGELIADSYLEPR